MEVDQNGNRRSETYWSLQELADYANRVGTLAKTKHDQSFTGSDSFDATVKLASEGWASEVPPAMEIADSAVTAILKEREVESPLAIYDVSGGCVDVGKFMFGEPECMIELPLNKISKVGSVVTLVSSVSVSGGVSTRDILKRGRMIVALALALSQLGHAIEIWVDSSNDDHRNYDGTMLYQRVQVKAVDDALDPATIMFGLAHPALYRHLLFATWDNLGHTHWGYAARRGRGAVSQRDEKATAMWPDGTIFTERLYLGSDPIETVKRQLRDLGLLAE